MASPGACRLWIIAAVVAGWLLVGDGIVRAAAASDIPATVDFERHIIGLFGKMGCNAGSCHGSFQGRGGFRLSLFGYDPEKDCAAVTRDVFGRRINRLDPDRSLILLKPTGQVPHGGGRRFAKDSWPHRLLRDWIVSGARWRKGSGDVASLQLTPLEHRFQKPGDAIQLVVRARFMEGDEEDITRLCDFRTTNDAVAGVSSEGLVRGLKPGDTAVVVSYRGNIVTMRVLVPALIPPGFHYPAVPTVNYIDREVFAKLRKLNIVPSNLASDTEFLRRVTIDTIGCLPSPEEVRAFVADSDPHKRAKKIDALLANPLHAALWATKFCDITGNNLEQLQPPREKRSKMWHDWFRKRIVDNVPYDVIVRGVLCATSREGRSPAEWLAQDKAIDKAALTGFDAPYAERASLDLFWRRPANKTTLQQWGEKTAAAFMGIRLECAQCHKHPYDRWTQADYRSYANIFGQVKFGVSPFAQKLVDAENRKRKMKKTGKKKMPGLPPVREVFISREKPLALTEPASKRPLPAKALGGPIIPTQPPQDARYALFEWLRSPDNPYFARSFANRIWGHYFGTGLVDPVDNFSLANPPSNARLLDALAKDFTAHQYDIRYMERTILNSRVYQLSAVPNSTNRQDQSNFSHSLVRRMMAEVVVDVLNSALGVTEPLVKSRDVPQGIRAIEVSPSRVQDSNLSYVFAIFGRPPRTTACDCQRGMEPALPQTLYLMTDPSLLAKMHNPKGRLHQLLTSGKTDPEILDELFLATLSRHPNAADKQRFAEHRARTPHREVAFADTLWALINTREFILNH